MTRKNCVIKKNVYVCNVKEWGRMRCFGGYKLKHNGLLYIKIKGYEEIIIFSSTFSLIKCYAGTRNRCVVSSLFGG